MKKTISLMLCLLLIFSSVNFAFAVDWSTTDQNNLQSIKNSVNLGGALYNLVTNCYNNLVSQLFIDDADVGRTSVTWWMREAVKDLDIISGTGTGTISFNILEILNQLSYFSSGGARQSWLQKIELDLLNNGIYLNSVNSNVQALSSDVASIKSVNTANLPGIYAYSSNIYSDTHTYLPFLGDLKQALANEYFGTTPLTNTQIQKNAHRSLLSSAGQYQLTSIGQRGQTSTTNIYWQEGTPLGNIALLLKQLLTNDASIYANNYNHALYNYHGNQTYTLWNGNSLTTATFYPSSAINGLYSWLYTIQTPIARLAYVHASDQEIDAREKAETNTAAIVDNFIDSTGSGAAPASSFGEVASMSAGYNSNMDTDAQPSGIWNIFNSNNFGWFSQETANQLDTTVSTRKGSSNFDTPLLDQQIAEIYKELGVDVND